MQVEDKVAAIGQEIGGLLADFARDMGENYGSKLYVMAHTFGDGLTDSLLAETTQELRDELHRHVSDVPMGAEILGRETMRNALIDRAETAMMGRYDKLAGGL